jgi:hypothetical protein
MNPEDIAAMHEDLERLNRPTLALLGGADTIDYTPDDSDYTPDDSDDTLSRDDTIATVVIDGQRYEIDWPRDVEDESQRSPWLAAIYTPDGELVDYVESGEPDGFRHETDVITAAMEWLAPDSEEEL